MEYKMIPVREKTHDKLSQKKQERTEQEERTVTFDEVVRDLLDT